MLFRNACTFYLKFFINLHPFSHTFFFFFFRINSMSNLQSLKSLPAKNCADKSVQCSKSTEFLKPSSPDRNNRFISPSYRAIGDDKKQSHDQRQNYEMCGKYSVRVVTLILFGKFDKINIPILNEVLKQVNLQFFLMSNQFSVRE